MKKKQYGNQEIIKVLIMKFLLFGAWYIVAFSGVILCCSLYWKSFKNGIFSLTEHIRRVIFIACSNIFKNINSFCQAYERQTLDQIMSLLKTKRTRYHKQNKRSLWLFLIFFFMKNNAVLEVLRWLTWLNWFILTNFSIIWQY